MPAQARDVFAPRALACKAPERKDAATAIAVLIAGILPVLEIGVYFMFQIVVDHALHQSQAPGHLVTGHRIDHLLLSHDHLARVQARRSFLPPLGTLGQFGLASLSLQSLRQVCVKTAKRYCDRMYQRKLGLASACKLGANGIGRVARVARIQVQSWGVNGGFAVRLCSCAIQTNT